jgi:exopolyphosphatase/guanosine-5'-triphosphate,3'-diphosphate pyrophosphatase
MNQISADRDRQRARRQRGAVVEPVYGAVDLGTNNCRMLVARATGRGFRVVDCFSRITRLGEGLSSGGLLSAAAMDRTLDALRHCAERMARAGVSRSRVVATEACRRADNCADFVIRVRRETGLNIEIIPAQEEARLALAGCQPLLSGRFPKALVFDIGGGSTELVWFCGRSETIEGITSLPLGVVSVAERYGEALSTSEGYEAVVADIAAQLAPFEAEFAIAACVARGEAQMLGTSGTVTTLAGVHLDLPRYDRSVVDGLELSFEAIQAASRRLAAMSCAGRAQHPCIGRDRADLVVAGCAILEAICRLWPVGRLRIADRGVREGILLSLMRADRAVADHAAPDHAAPDHAVRA